MHPRNRGMWLDGHPASRASLCVVGEIISKCSPWVFPPVHPHAWGRETADVCGVGTTLGASPCIGETCHRKIRCLRCPEHLCVLGSGEGYNSTTFRPQIISFRERNKFRTARGEALGSRGILVWWEGIDGANCGSSRCIPVLGGESQRRGYVGADAAANPCA